MIFFGPISSIFDFATFGIMLWIFHAGPALFHTGWFVESLATQTLVIFVIRTRRVPFFRSRPSVPLLLAAFAVVIAGAALPYTPLGHVLGFRPLPSLFFFALAGIVVCYLVLIEIGKYWFYRLYHAPPAPAPRHRTPGHRVHRRAAASPSTPSQPSIDTTPVQARQ
jgi:P-type Mg2+ transporter